MLYELIGHADFLYVADCKLASSENLSHIATRGGRFVTVLPRGRSEDIAFRQRLHATPSVLKWTLLHKLTNNDGYVLDELFICGDEQVHSEGYRLLWYRSTRKAQQDKSQTCPDDPEGDRGAERLAGTPPRSTHPVPRAVQGGTGGGGAPGGDRGELLAGGGDRGTGGRDLPPGKAGPTERANPVSEGDTIAFHTDVEAERGGDLGSGAGGWRIPAVDQ